MKETIYIRNMVCNRCIMVVTQEFEKAGLKPSSVKMGEVELTQKPSSVQMDKISNVLKDLGFEILDDQKQKLIEKIKTLLIDKIQAGEMEEHFILSDFIGKTFNKDYSQLSRLFSEVEGVTIEQFFIHQKIEKVKELIAYNELTLSEIAWKLGYSSVAHLSSQFKKVTGFTPTHYRNIRENKRKSLDEV